MIIFPILISLALLAGNLIRFTVGNGGVTILDLIVTLVVFLGFCDWLLYKRRLPVSGIWLIFFSFLAIVALATAWGIALWGWDWGAVLYLPRLIVYFMLLPITVFWLDKNSEKHSDFTWYLMLITAIGISLLGFIQLYLFPDFEFMEISGWDPHQGRLLSTWFDPNFTGGFLALISVLLLNQVLIDWQSLFRNEKKIFNKNFFLTNFSLLITLTALALTFSRSAWLSFIIGAVIITLFRSWKVFLLGIVIVAIAIISSSRAQERIAGAFHIDVTSSYRIQSWQNALTLWQSSPWLGVGYNYLRLVQSREGMTADEEVHSAGGSDSTFLTILVTTGILGALTWLTFFLEILAISWHKFKKQKNSIFLGIFGGLIVLFIDSWFINALLFPFILTPFLIMVGVLVTKK